MKKIITLMLAVCLCLLLAAPASAADDASPFVGNWKFYAQEGEAPMSHEEILAMAEMGFDMANGMITSFRGDGSFSMNVFGAIAKGTWTDNGDGTGVFGVEGESYPMSVQDGFLRMDLGNGVGVFEPSDTSADDSTAGIPPILEEYASQFEMPEQQAIVSPLVGEWRFYSMESEKSELDIPHDALPEQLEKGRDYAGKYTLTFMDDGWFKFCNFYGFEQNNWSDSGSGTATIFADGEKWDCSMEDGLLILKGSDRVMRYEKIVPVGTTGYCVVVPGDYVQGEVTEEQRQDDMIAYYRSSEHLLDFDVYQYGSNGRTLTEYVAIEAKQYGSDRFESTEINGIPVCFYTSKEQYDGVDYRVVNCLFAAGDDFGELSFWMDGEDAPNVAEQILGSLFYRAPEPEDVHGVIVEKLKGYSYPDRYLVRGNDGELYEAEYFFGFEDLAPGTEVILSVRGSGWEIELEDPWAAFDFGSTDVTEMTEPVLTSAGPIDI